MNATGSKAAMPRIMRPGSAREFFVRAENAALQGENENPECAT
jgi:hypothetical protein